MNANPYKKISVIVVLVVYFFSVSFSLNPHNLKSQSPSLTSTICTSWNLEMDFRISPNQENPNRDWCGNYVWYFMKGPSSVRDPGNYSLLSNFQSDFYGITGLQGWYDDFEPSIGKNTTENTQFALTIAWPPNIIKVHPGENETIIIGWESPISGTVRITGFFIDIDDKCGNGISWYIDKDIINITSGEIVDGGSEYLQQGTGGNILDGISINKGQFLYTIIDGPGADYGCDSTGVSLTIQEIK